MYTNGLCTIMMISLANSWMVCFKENLSKMDDDWKCPHDLGELHISMCGLYCTSLKHMLCLLAYLCYIAMSVDPLL